jgi:protein-S-isoprenylcysteine O-methyltransferase Ste14
VKATRFEFRFRLAIGFLSYCLGFGLPWLIYHAGGPRVTSTWLELSGALARTHLLSLQYATVLVTLLALLFAAAGGALRVWGAAYIGTGIMTSGVMHAQSVLAAGPYRHVRNPLYFGSFVFCFAVAILMAPLGAIIFLVAIFVQILRLILGEEAYLTAQQGHAYIAYKTRVPRLIPTLAPRVPASTSNPRWARAILAESYPVAMTLCFAVLAWRYNVDLLIRALIICFGASLVVRGFIVEKPARGQTH